MPDARFFPPAGPFSLLQLVEIVGAELPAGADPGRMLANVAPLDSATADDVSFLDNRLYVDQFRATAAGCVIVASRFAGQAPDETSLLISEHPYLSYARVATAFHPHSDSMYSPSGGEANVHGSAIIGAGTKIANGAVIGPRAYIGTNSVIGANAYVGQGVQIGNDCRIAPLASVRCAVLGDRVVLHAGARLGEPGFGFAITSDGTMTIPQLGRVIVGDDVEIGANSTVDRGAGPDTVIGEGTRIDNLVQIGHNVRVGRRCVIAGMVGIAGSTTIGDGVMLGGQSGVAGHLTVGQGARVAAQAGIIRSVPPGATVMGLPAVPIKQFFRQAVALSKLSQKGEDRE